MNGFKINVASGENQIFYNGIKCENDNCHFMKKENEDEHFGFVKQVLNGHLDSFVHISPRFARKYVFSECKYLIIIIIIIINIYLYYSYFDD